MKPVRISQFNYLPIYLPIYIAKEKALFPFPLTFENRNDDTLVVEDVFKGRADISIGDPVISAYEKYQEKILTIGYFIKSLPIHAITLNQLQKPFKSFQKFRGLKIGCFSELSTMYMMFKHLLGEVQLDIEKDLEVIFVEPHRELGLLYSGEADFLLVLEPVLSQAIANGAHSIYTFEDKFPPMTISGFTASKTTDSGMLRGFLQGVQKGLDIIWNQEEEAFKICQQYFPDVEERALRHAFLQLKRTGWTKDLKIPEKAWKEALKIRPELDQASRTYTNKFCP